MGASLIFFLSFVIIIGIGIVLVILLRRGSDPRKGQSTIERGIETSNQMRICTACGVSNPKENQFCDKCGTKLED